SKGSLFFRNFLYAVGFQSPFQLQSNSSAAHAGAIWQKFIRRAAAIKFKDEKAVNDVHCTLVDHTLGSCGEISNWIDGRTWRLEVDKYVDLLTLWEKGEVVESDSLGSPEYRAKKKFLHEFVTLLHEMGAHEFARQYEWSTWKSQPNVLKRLETEGEPDSGLTAVDFRAGLTLLPFLPMSPGDIKLIIHGIQRGSLVQFDRGDLNQLEIFINKHQEDFRDMFPLLEELRHHETIYRNSTLDITRNLTRIFIDRTLRSTIFTSTISGWKLRNLIDNTADYKLSNSKFLFAFFVLLGFIPFLGNILRKFFGRRDYRSHYIQLIYNFSYLKRTLLANRIETIIRWHRRGRITEEKAEIIYKSLFHYLYHLTLSFFPVSFHRFFSDRQYFLESLYNVMIKPIRLYFNASLREEWLKEMVEEGEQRQVISKSDAKKILSQIDEPFIHKYLQSLAVHVAMSPITRIISVGIAILYLLSRPNLSLIEALTIGAGIIAFFQIIPVSPGSLARGIYVLFVVIKERNFKDYSLALPLSFFKYVGYFSFPIQMTYRYPTLARCMVGFWTTKLVNVIPVFGESGALLEHKVFTFSYNWPLTIRRKFWERKDEREMQKPRYWHIFLIIALLGVFGGYASFLYMLSAGSLPPLLYTIPILMILALITGFFINVGSGGASSMQRVMFGVFGGIASGLAVTVVLLALMPSLIPTPLVFFTQTIWQSFVMASFCALGAFLAEFKF
ncbi:MAG: hypothetical protein JNM46_09215, partial [Anaerolineales bacterium]|nr:hypothetical protein [Anaerolineales bacterium]